MNLYNKELSNTCEKIVRGKSDAGSRFGQETLQRSQTRWVSRSKSLDSQMLSTAGNWCYLRDLAGEGKVVGLVHLDTIKLI